MLADPTGEARPFDPVHPFEGDSHYFELQGEGTANGLMNLSGAKAIGNLAAGPELIAGTNQAGQLTSRGKFRVGTLNNAWDEAEPGPTGGRLCSTCGGEVKVPPNTGVARDWHGSHNPSWTRRYFSPLLTRGEVLNNYNEGVTLECPICNIRGGNNDSRFSR
jgi:hypothetical protein